ncbi:MAG: ABC transporter ATP-binding protein, partial [Acidimicrobiia bacterium]
RIVAEGSPRELIEEHATREVVELRFRSDAEQSAALPQLRQVGSRIEELADRVLLYTDKGEADVERLAVEGVHPETLLVRRASLEDVFLTLTGRTLEE